MSLDSILSRASAAKAVQAKRKWARKRIRRYTPNLPIKGKVVFKFYHYPPGEWIFVAASSRGEVRKHPLYDDREFVSLATLRDLNTIAIRLLKKLPGEMLAMPPERMRSHTRGHQAVRHQK